ncbi:MAG: heavy metal translocating P-type ATPase [Desulfurococcaceae archaeon]|nr:heavy metal translocating P-type ATPase [Desulfurococcaceae archaeon]
MLRKEKLRIIGVDCPTCVYAIKRNLLKLRGLVNFDVDISSGDAIVEYRDEETTLRDVYMAIRDAGYDVEKRVINIHLDFAPEEAPRIEERLVRIRGVLDVNINPVTKTAKITYNTQSTGESEVLSELTRMGVSYSEPREVETKRRDYTLYRRLVAFSLGLLAIAIGMSSVGHGLELRVVLFAISAIVITLSLDIIKRGFRALVSLRPTMESLISLSSITTFITGAALLAHELQHSFHTASLFEASAGVLGFVGLGLYLEERLRHRALRYLNQLESSLRGVVRVVRNGSVVEVDISEVSVGDVVEVKAGNRVVVDGVVVEGWGYVDESTFTGESTPVIKRSENRDPVLAGSKLVSGYLRVRATRVREDTVLSHILESAKAAVFYKPSFQRLADRVVGVLTWIVMVIALVAFTAWWLVTRDPVFSVVFTASILAVACPCPLGIAIPLAVSIGVIVASKRGVLIRRGDVFERIVKSNVVIFDKTGTLTKGKPRVVNFTVYGNADHRDVLAYTCSVESRSEHVLAQAILEYCRERGVNTTDPGYYEHIPGLGVIGRIGSVEVVIGNVKLLEDMGISVESEVLGAINEIGEKGGTPILVGVNGRVAGVFEIRDELRSDAVEVVEYFKTEGFRLGLASGDVKSSVEYVRQKLKLDFAHASLKPFDKARVIREVQSSGSLVVYIGDGVNDAVALSTAHLGVAMGRAPDVAREAGDVVLLSNDLRGLKALYCISKRVVRTAKENIFWAFIYNAVLVPLAAGVLYPFTGLVLRPEMAALAMVLSDISVILNSSRLLISRAC